MTDEERKSVLNAVDVEILRTMVVRHADEQISNACEKLPKRKDMRCSFRASFDVMALFAIFISFALWLLTYFFLQYFKIL